MTHHDARSMPFDELPGQVVHVPAITGRGVRIVAIPVLHARHPIGDGYPDLPLCWVLECAQRVGGHDDQAWHVAFDHDAVPSYALVTTEQVTCPDCLEWIHA